MQLPMVCNMCAVLYPPRDRARCQAVGYVGRYHCYYSCACIVAALSDQFLGISSFAVLALLILAGWWFGRRFIVVFSPFSLFTTTILAIVLGREASIVDASSWSNGAQWVESRPTPDSHLPVIGGYGENGADSESSEQIHPLHLCIVRQHATLQY